MPSEGRGQPLTSDLRERIRQEYEIEQQRGAIARLPSDIPFDFDSIAPEWFGHLVCREHSGAEVTGFRLGDPNDGTANRRRVYLSYNDAGQAAGLPASVFCKATQSLVNRQITASLSFTTSEVNFYNRHREQLDIDAPRALLATYDPRSWNSIIVMHDLELEDVIFGELGTDVTHVRAQNQLDLLAKLHAAGFGDQRSDLSDLREFETNFWGMDETFGLEDICTHGFADAEEVIPPALFRRADEIWPATLRALQLHNAHPRTFTHVDCHLGNWYFRPGDKMGVCDFQTFSRGHFAHDVTYAMTTSLTVEDRRSSSDELLGFYLDALRRYGGPEVSMEEMLTFYRQHLFIALAWWTSTLTVAITQPRHLILGLIGRITTAMDDLDALGSIG
jgi:hypothetical protein